LLLVVSRSAIRIEETFLGGAEFVEQAGPFAALRAGAKAADPRDGPIRCRGDLSRVRFL
jgi:hypothetical protein